MDPWVLRPARRRDRSFIGALATEAFASYGEYGPLLLDWFGTSGVEATIAEDEAGPAGLTVVAFVADPESAGGWVADLLAIAVALRARRRGLGRRLLEAAVARAVHAARRWPVRGVRLSVAEDNLAARALFEDAGFEYTGREEGFYPRGQRALHMRRPV
ncbi:MAG TPA: GNAT family N-acetyltransferase [Vicinamibacteria bacterium]|nr:GNAT family N-acetyltransferase [Vicinamibacteria bacterium]